MPDSAVLLDLDGVIIESRRAITRCLNDALAANGYRVRSDEELIPMIGPPLAAAFAELTNQSADSAAVGRLVASYRDHYASASLRDTELIAGMDGVLHEMARNWPLALATSKSVDFVRPLLGRFGVEELFEVVCAPAMETLHEPKGETIRRALAELGEPVKAVMVGDRSHDIMGARANHIPCIGVTWGIGDVKELTSAGADSKVDSPPQLVGAIRLILGK